MTTMPLLGLLKPFQIWNDTVLQLGRWLSIAAITLMVLAILVQVFFRYVLNNALPWPDEAARFMMLWMTGLMAPMAYRRGGFVAIDMLVEALPSKIGAALSFCLLLISGAVLAFAAKIGWGEFTGFGGRFATASLYVPTALDFSQWFRVPRSWMMASLFVGVVLLLIVNIELILRSLITMTGGGAALKPLVDEDLTVE
ncbi:TRAP transporter small permease [Mesobacterium sp. TK19101]|uniref:TRAP transporter small permease protein n=1 Tax=Mesobacterium hydrothermale TaxID=3111907 RepID=A0ABU6HL14_9RHOB|nr:TRAP transporter small permease [Mesobacterium sp. TK19101]MEC3863147.1 TRAP transporter small permease [Mesobacterium sp. TK19101]